MQATSFSPVSLAVKGALLEVWNGSAYCSQAEGREGRVLVAPWLAHFPRFKRDSPCPTPYPLLLLTDSQPQLHFDFWIRASDFILALMDHLVSVVTSLERQHFLLYLLLLPCYVLFDSVDEEIAVVQGLFYHNSVQPGSPQVWILQEMVPFRRGDGCTNQVLACSLFTVHGALLKSKSTAILRFPSLLCLLLMTLVLIALTELACRRLQHDDKEHHFHKRWQDPQIMYRRPRVMHVKRNDTGEQSINIKLKKYVLHQSVNSIICKC